MSNTYDFIGKERMTWEECKEIFYNKYPNGSISVNKNNTKAKITFKENSKLYNYSFSSFGELLGRVGFNILYKSDILVVKNQIKELETKIKEGGQENLFAPNSYLKYTDEQINKMNNELEENKKRLEEMEQSKIELENKIN